MNRIAIIIVNHFAEPIFCLTLDVSENITDVDILCMIKECFEAIPHFNTAAKQIDYRGVPYVNQFDSDMRTVIYALLEKSKTQKGVMESFIDNHKGCNNYDSIIYISGANNTLYKRIEKNNTPVYARYIYKYCVSKKGEGKRRTLNFYLNENTFGMKVDLLPFSELSQKEIGKIFTIDKGMIPTYNLQ